MSQRYEIIDMLSQDGNGVAYLAQDKESDTEVVLRRFFPFGPNGGGLAPQDCHAYEQSVEKLKTLSHPSLRKVLDGGTDPLDGLPFLVTESLGGRPLLHRLQEVTLEPAVAKQVLQQAIETSLALSELLGEEAVWIETETKGIMLHPESNDREMTFRLSPMRWLGGEKTREGLGSLLRLAEEITGWGTRIVSDTAGEGLGGWVKTLRNNSDQWTLEEALAELQEPGSSAKLKKKAEPTKPTPAPVVRPPGAPRRKSTAKPTTSSQPVASSLPTAKPTPSTEPVAKPAPQMAAQASPQKTEPLAEAEAPAAAPTQATLSPTGQMVFNSEQTVQPEIKSPKWPWIAGSVAAALIVGLFVWQITRDPYGDLPPVTSAPEENANGPAEDPSVANLDPGTSSNPGPNSEPNPQPNPQTAGGNPSTPPTPDPSQDPVNARLVEIGKDLHGKIGQEVELEPMKVVTFSNMAGILEFGTIRGPNAVCGVISNASDRQQGIRKILKQLTSDKAMVGLKGKVVKLKNGRVGVEILTEKNLIVNGAPAPTTANNTPPKPDPSKPKVDPKIDARLVEIGKDLRNKIGQEVEIEPFKAMAFENDLLEFGSQKTSNTICGWVDASTANPRTTLKNRLQKYVDTGAMVVLKGKVVKLPSGRIAIHINMGHNANAVKAPKPPAPTPKPPAPKPGPTAKVDPKVDALVLDTGKSLRKQIGQVVGLEPMQVVAYENGYVEFGSDRGPNAICGWIDFTPSNQKNTLQNRMRTLASKKTWVMLNGKVLETRDGRIAIQIVTPHNALDVDPKNPAASIPRQPKPAPKPQPKPQPNPANAGQKPPQDLVVLALAKALEGKVGSKVKIGPLKVISYDGKTLEFTNKQKDKAVCGVMGPQGEREQGTNALLMKLHKDGATVWLKGKVVKLPGGRIAIEVLGQKSIELENP